MKGFLLTLSALLWSLQSAAAQESPFFDHPNDLRVAYATEATSLQLETLLLDTEDGEEGESGEEGEEGEEKGVGSVLPLFAGSLEAQDPALLAEIEATLEEIEQLTADDEAGREEAVGNAQGLLTQARNLLIAEEVRNTPEFQAGVITMLSILEPGVGEGYEEAAEGETEAYYFGWVGLQRVKELWSELQNNLDEGAQTAEIERAFGVLDSLMATPELPERFSDPEDAEVAVNDLVFGLELATGATILPRDLSSVAALAAEQVEAGCAAAQERLTVEHAAFAYVLYDRYLGRPLSFVATEAGETVDSSLESLQEAPASEAATGLCAKLPQTFEEARIALGGQ